MRLIHVRRFVALRQEQLAKADDECVRAALECGQLCSWLRASFLPCTVGNQVLGRSQLHHCQMFAWARTSARIFQVLGSTLSKIDLETVLLLLERFCT